MHSWQPPASACCRYQLQSLGFMLDCEQGEGGFRRLFWKRLQTPGGVHYWWSPVLGRASLEVPAQPWGGWCAEEMGESWRWAPIGVPWGSVNRRPARRRCVVLLGPKAFPRTRPPATTCVLTEVTEVPSLSR